MTTAVVHCTGVHIGVSGNESTWDQLISISLCHIIARSGHGLHWNPFPSNINSISIMQQHSLWESQLLTWHTTWQHGNFQQGAYIQLLTYTVNIYIVYSLSITLSWKLKSCRHRKCSCVVHHSSDKVELASWVEVSHQCRVTHTHNPLSVKVRNDYVNFTI